MELRTGRIGNGGGAGDAARTGPSGLIGPRIAPLPNRRTPWEGGKTSAEGPRKSENLETDLKGDGEKFSC